MHLKKYLCVRGQLIPPYFFVLLAIDTYNIKKKKEVYIKSEIDTECILFLKFNTYWLYKTEQGGRLFYRLMEREKEREKEKKKNGVGCGCMREGDGGGGLVVEVPTAP
jgi:hypothetical protein